MNSSLPCMEDHGILPGGADYPGQLFQAHASSSTTPGKFFPFIELLDALRDGEPFFDIGEDYKYIKEIKYLKEKGIIKGDDKGYFNPKENITREEVAIVVYRVMKLTKQN